MALYWSGDRKIVVTRHPMDDTHIADISAILGYENLIFRTVASGQPGHSICADLAADERALSDVIELLDNSPADGPVTVEAFGSTPQYSHLVTIIGKNSRRPVIDRMTPDSYLESVPAPRFQGAGQRVFRGGPATVRSAAAHPGSDRRWRT